MTENLPTKQTRIHGTAIQGRTIMGYCKYCGAALISEFYFCPTCASPYQPVEEVISPAIPRRLTEAELIRVKVPQVWTLLGYILGALLLPLIPMALVWDAYGPDVAQWTLMSLQIGALTIITIVFGARFWTSLKVQLVNIGFTHGAAWLGLVLLAPLLLLNYGWNVSLLELLGVDVGEAGQELEQVLGLGGSILLICVFPAIMEELAFRGMLQHWLQTTIRPWRAILAASALFAAAHFSLYSYPVLFAVGILLGWMKYKTRSLYPCMVVHFLHNLAVILWF